MEQVKCHKCGETISFLRGSAEAIRERAALRSRVTELEKMVEENGEAGTHNLNKGCTESFTRHEFFYHPLRPVSCDCGWRGQGKDLLYDDRHIFYCPKCESKGLWWEFMEEHPELVFLKRKRILVRLWLWLLGEKIGE